jgi:uncharacterized protein
MKEDIKKLLVLQEIEQGMKTLKEQIAIYPPMLKQLEKTINRKKDEFKSRTEKRMELKKSRREMEKEIKYKEEEISKKMDKQLTPKIKQDAYDALKHEIQNLENKISLIEDKMLENINQEEELEKILANAENTLKYEIDENQIEQKRINEQINRKKKKYTDFKKELEKQMPKVPPELLSYYKRFAHGYGPNVVVSIEGDSCGGCHMRLLPQVIVEIHKGDSLVCCEGCRRVLISDGSDTMN